MHILFVTAEYPPDLGGVGAYTAELARALTARGAVVSVLAPARGGAGPAPVERVPGVLVYPAVERWGSAIWRQVGRAARDLGADWLHVQYQTAAFGMNPAINFGPECWRRQLPVAWTYHDLLPPYLFPKAGAALRSRVTQRPAHFATLTVTTNESDRQALAAAGLSAHYIPIGSNVPGRELRIEDRAALRATHGYTNETALIGFFGFLNRSKGAPTLLQMVSRLVERGIDAHLLLIGEGLGASDPTNRATLAEVQALVAELGLSDRVHSTGALGDEDVAAALNAVDLLVLPFADGASLRRGTLMAGLANGCAILTSAPQGPLPELVAGRDLTFAPAGDDAAFADAAAALLRDPAALAALRSHARRAALQFTWESIADRHLALYTALGAAADAAGAAGEVAAPSA